MFWQLGVPSIFTVTINVMGHVGYNTISGAMGDGIWTVVNDDVTIEYNHILSSSGFASIQALNHVGTGIVMHANTITNSGGKGINYWAADGGEITDNVITNSKYEAIYTDAQATISGNQISGGNMYGILVVAWTGGTAAGGTVSGNTISNTNWEGIQSDVSVTVTNNDISGGDWLWSTLTRTISPSSDTPTISMIPSRSTSTAMGP